MARHMAINHRNNSIWTKYQRTGHIVPLRIFTTYINRSTLEWATVYIFIN